MGYLNKHEGDVLLAFAETFSELGREKAKKNAWSGGSYVLEEAKIVGIDGTKQIKLEVTVQERGKQSKMERVTVDLGA
jgi:RAB protein geranylgeranyltransferase component A